MEKVSFLSDLKPGQEGEIISITGGLTVNKRLADLGMTSGTKIKLIKKAPFSGPIKIEAHGSKFILGRGLASKISIKII